jgi:hypothetical protein
LEKKGNEKMKKMMVLVTLMAFASMTQAASMLWGGDSMYNSQGSGYAMGEGTTIWLIFLGNTAPAGAVTEFNYTTGLTNLGGTIIDTAGVTGWGYNGTYGAAGVDVNGYWMVAVWGPTTPTYFAYYMNSLSGVPLSGAGDNVSIAVPSLDVGMMQGAVPEPTAMALLALGAAAVGLRRRFRK